MVQNALKELIGSQFHNNAPAPTMRKKLARTGEVKRMCEELIRKAHRDRDSKITVKKHGSIIDDNSHRVEAFAFEFGRVEVDQTLYRVLVVDMLSSTVYLLLIRSDVTMSLHALFPDIGTVQDWKALQKCAAHFSPKSSSHRYIIDVKEAHYAAAEAAAAQYLAQSGVFQYQDIAVFQNMDITRFHLLDLGTIVALESTFPDDLAPRMIHVLLTHDADDLDEVQRVFKALDLSAGTHTSGLYVPSIPVKGKNSLDIWRKSSRFSYFTYGRPQDVDCLFTSISQTLALNDSQFSRMFPHTPVVVGSSIWSARVCTEIDIRGLRFTDEELLVGRKYVATLLKNHEALMYAFANAWAHSIATQEAAIMEYSRLWFQAFHFAIGQTIFPASNALFDYLELTRNSDTSRMRLRDDRKQRYDRAIAILKAATKETPWLYPMKPQAKAEALALLKGAYDAFLHQKDGHPVLAFTEESLIRCCGLERQEVDDFMSKLKLNHMLTNKTHPVSFANREQHRFICINADKLSLTDDIGKEGRG